MQLASDKTIGISATDANCPGTWEPQSISQRPETRFEMLSGRCEMLSGRCEILSGRCEMLSGRSEMLSGSQVLGLFASVISEG